MARAKSPKDLADRMASRRALRLDDDGYIRQTFTLPLEQAREAARSFFVEFPKAAYMTEVEHWRELPGGMIEFTMRRLRTAD